MPPSTTTTMTDAEKYTHAKELNRLRQKKYYDANKAKLLQARKDIRTLVKEDKKDDDVTELASNKEVLEKLMTSDGKSSSNTKYRDDLKTVLGFTECSQLSECLKYPSKIINMIDTSIQKRSGKDYSINSKKGFIQSILVSITKLKIKLPKKTVDLYKAYFEKLKLISSDELKGKKVVQVENFNTYLEKVKAKYGDLSKEYVLSRLYDEATLRDDFGHLEIVKNMSEVNKNTQQNYIIVPQRAGKIKLFIQAYKTDAKYGDIDVVLSADLTKLIKGYIKIKNIPYNGYLFGNNPNGLTDFVSKMNKNLDVVKDGAISNFRHMKSTIINANEPDVDTRIKIAFAMKHSPFIHETYLRKLIEYK